MNNQKKREKIVKDLKSWRQNQAEAYKTYIKTSAVGLEVGLSIAVAALLGYFADKYFESSPWGMIIGVVIGSIAAGKRLWMFSKSYLEKNKKDDDK
jgi:F0F1-type ATP synthase assembly protein I